MMNILTSVAILCSIVCLLPPVLCILRKEPTNNARLLVSKTLLNNHLVQDMDAILQYSFHNVGLNPIFDVHLQDPSPVEYPPNMITIIGGKTDVFLGNIPPASNVTHTIVFRPHFWGYVNFTSAKVTFKQSEAGPTVNLLLTSMPQPQGISSYIDFKRQFSSHLFDWCVFAILSLPSLFVPLVLWYKSDVKYESLVKKEKQSKSKE